MGDDRGATSREGAWPLDALAKEIRRRRSEGARIVLTNGCFDLLHVGHVRTLQAARALGDVLVLALNSDASVRKLKGPDRPVIPEDERAELLSALTCVDYVVVFDEPDPRKVVLALEPEVLVKGGDWTPETVIGREEVEARGGRVVVLPDIPGARTSSLIEKVRAGKCV
ncbi:MAG: D-glycero-beta-D-manno-heptose 1-phosphate adenylyltransferase [Deltaproteobacteria bacterium]|nr:D-glycero-beta-D-manno-heptose 1-phosphate adenylyltransferase [Deltaproteobacteria bacterium]